MPPRWMSLGVVFLWLGMTGWLFVREFWPHLQPGQPPPFRIDLADEAQNNIPVRWSIFKENERRGYARTWVNFRERSKQENRDTDKKDEWEFELGGEFKLWYSKETRGQADFVVRSQYRVTREGELREFQSKVSINLKTPVPRRPENFDEDNEQAREVELFTLSGEVRDGLCYPHLILAPDVKKYAPFVAFMERDQKPVPMPQRASILNPLEPVNKLAKVRKGQRWRVPMVDPLTFFGQRSPRVEYLNAEVSRETLWLKWGNRKDPVPCLEIRYEGDDISGFTWIQQDDGLVVGQEITQHGDTLRLMRD
jgi:hypothetical protein